ncbi:MAG: hypothetical protein QXG08_03135 [Candidatus Methanomethyliaceae archaeon]
MSEPRTTNGVPPSTGDATGVGEAFPGSDPSLPSVNEMLREYKAHLTTVYPQDVWGYFQIASNEKGKIELDIGHDGGYTQFIITTKKCKLEVDIAVYIDTNTVCVDVIPVNTWPMSLCAGCAKLNKEALLLLLQKLIDGPTMSPAEIVSCLAAIVSEDDVDVTYLKFPLYYLADTLEV